MESQTVRHLVELGLTALEAEIYVFLARGESATGYRVAQALGKPVANTYKAIESLQLKGAIEVEDGESRTCRAVPPEEFLGRLEREFLDRRRKAGKELSRLAKPAADDRLYTIRSSAQVIERARAMLGRAEKVVLIDAFPRPLLMLKPDLEAAASRGVDVLVHNYDTLKIAGVTIVPEQRPSEVLGRTPGEHVGLVVDAREYLVALIRLGGTGVHQAVWTRSSIVATNQHIGMLYEMMLAEVELRLNEGEPTAEELRRALKPYRKHYLQFTPGYEAWEAMLKEAAEDPATTRRGPRRSSGGGAGGLRERREPGPAA